MLFKQLGDVKFAVVLLMYCLSLNDVASARPVPDETLGNERSTITEERIRDTPSDRIRGGATRGQNLFHSFSEFNVETGRGAYFENPAGIENIFSRVTGNTPSQIDGRLGVIQAGSIDTLGNANLFFINPNGIVFGQNASLDVGGSFVGTTANAIGFGNVGSFSATNPEFPQLLTVNPSVFLFNQLPRDVVVQSTHATENTINGTVFGLKVPDNHSLILLGGNVILDGGSARGGVNAFGGRIELGGLREAGTVQLALSEDLFTLAFPAQTERADVSILNNTAVIVYADKYGDISINARNVNISQSSAVMAGIGVGLGGINHQAGDLIINTTGTLRLFNNSQISNIAAGIGAGGNIAITAKNIELVNGSFIGAASVGQGNAGNINVQADDTISFSGRFSASTPFGIINNASGIFSSIGSLLGFEGIGQGGNVELQARRISLTDGAVVSTSNAAASGSVPLGTVGNIRINTTDLLSLSNAFITSSTNGESNAGNLTINSDGDISLTSGGRLLTLTNGRGNAGNINVQADGSIMLDGAGINLNRNRNASGIFSSINQVSGATESRRAGAITLNAKDLTVSNGAYIQSNVEAGAVGEGGNIDVTANTVSLLNGGQVQSILRNTDTVNGLVGGRGRSGNIRITANELFRLNGRDPSLLPSAVFTSVGAGAEGTGGNIEITAGSLSLSNGGNLTTSTFGIGNAGNVSVTARDAVTLEESGTTNTSGIFSEVNFEAIGNSGDIKINAGSISLSSSDVAGSRVDISSTTSGQGNAGRINLDIEGGISLLRGSQIFSLSNRGGQGNAGDISIDARSLILRDGGEIASSIFRTENGIPGGQGEKAGDIRINVNDLIDIDGISSTGFSSGIFANTQRGASGRGGSIDITTGRLRVANGGVITAQTLNSSDSGNITIHADSLRASGGGQIVANTTSGGNAGGITLKIADTITLTGSDPNFRNRSIRFPNAPIANTSPNSGIFATTESGSTGNGGTITIRGARSLNLAEGAQISAATSGTGIAGNIFLRALDSISLNNATISTALRRGATLNEPSENRGNIDINTQSLSLNNRATVTSSTSGQGNTGTINIYASEHVSLTNGSRITSVVNSNATGNSRRISLNTPDLNLRNNAQISAATNGNGSAGNVQIEADRFSLSDSTISTQVGRNAVVPRNRNARSRTQLDDDRQGNIMLNTRSIDLNDASITSRTNGRGSAGDIVVRNADTISIDRSSISSAVGAESTGRGGNIEINTNNLALNQGRISARTQAQGQGGTITVNAGNAIESIDGDIETRSANSSSGNVSLSADSIRLRGDSDIRTQVGQGAGIGGSISLSADSIVAYHDSDIVTRATEGQGGDITIDSPAFFAEGYIPDTKEDQDVNDRVDIDASGVQSGVVTTPDVSFIQNSLSDLPDSAIDSDQLLANSCIARTESGGAFLVTGAGGLPESPDNPIASTYPTGEVRSIPVEATPQSHWQSGDAIVEPQGVYRLPDGRLIMSRECQ